MFFFLFIAVCRFYLTAFSTWIYFPCDCL